MANVENSLSGGNISVPIEGLIDSLTVGLALGIVAAKVITRWKRSKTPIASVGLCGVDFLHGSVVLPFVMMVGAVFNHTVYEYLKSASPGTTALAGGIGLFFVIGELSKME
jgi:hypothetical protein